MANSGEVYQRTDGKWAFRITASNGQIVATDGGQGYESKSDALDTLEKVIGGRYDDKPHLRHYQTLRRIVGGLGIGLPLIVALGAWILPFGDGVGIQDSISDYYYTIMRGVFIGILFAIGVFLYSYKGYERSKDMKRFEPSDSIAGNLACGFALGVALFPTTEAGAVGDWVGKVHFFSATALFLTLAYFSLRLFTKTAEGGERSPQKVIRDTVYKTSGWIILVCIGLIALYSVANVDKSSGLASLNPVFWLEALALWAFGWSWFVKGEILLGDAD